jgi:putative membrane protein
MDKLQNYRGTGRFFVAAVLATAMGACATSRAQPPATDANLNVAAAPEVAQPVAQKAKIRSAMSGPVPSQAALSRRSTSTILGQIHQANLKEISIARIAERKASTGEVRAYADQLVQDHTNADQTVLAMSQKMGTRLHAATVPQNGRHASSHGDVAEQKLNSASGAGFDRLFLQQTSSDHERLIRALQQEREDAIDDDLEALIDKMIPILEQHRELAQILLKKEQT